MILSELSVLISGINISPSCSEDLQTAIRCGRCVFQLYIGCLGSLLSERPVTVITAGKYDVITVKDWQLPNVHDYVPSTGTPIKVEKHR